MIYTKINLMIPSWHRRELLTRCVKSAYDKAEVKHNILLTLCINESDHSYDDMPYFEPHTHIIHENTTTPNLSHYYNLMYEKTQFNDLDTLVSMIGDDMVFETQGWDQRVLEKINEVDGVGLVHCEDVFMQHGHIPVNLFTSRKLVDAMGVPFMCPDFAADWIDTAWGELATLLDINYFLPDVIIRHDHALGPRGRDETTKRLEPQSKANASAMWKWINAAAANIKEAGLV